MTRLISTLLFLLRLSMALALFWVAGFLVFVGALPHQVEDSATRTDAIIVLTGGRDRLATGLILLHRGMADQVLISGVPPEVDRDDLLRQIGHSPQDQDPRIHLGHQAGNTVGNAAESAAWVGAHGITSIRMVTGAYHMPRALLEFRHAMPHITIIPHPVFPDAVKSSEWWRWPGTALLLATEYTKTLVVVLRHWFLSAGRFVS